MKISKVKELNGFRVGDRVKRRMFTGVYTIEEIYANGAVTISTPATAEDTDLVLMYWDNLANITAA